MSKENINLFINYVSPTLAIYLKFLMFLFLYSLQMFSFYPTSIVFSLLPLFLGPLVYTLGTSYVCYIFLRMLEPWNFHKFSEKALRKKRLDATKSSSKTNRNIVDDGGLGLGFVKYKKIFEWYRVLISGGKNRDSRNICEKTVDKTRDLEALPQDILVRIICGVEHGDLKQLFNVSKTIREATLIAKKWHFEYMTPKKTMFFKSGLDSDMVDEIEVPLMRKHCISRIKCVKKLSKISMALFK